MRSFLFLVFGTLALGSVAWAQSPAATSANGYVEVVGQSAFGNVTSQSYGAEIGFNLTPTIQIFVEAGKVANVAPSSLGTSAQLIAGYLGSSFTMTAKEPATFGLGGLRFPIPTSSSLLPYVMVGGGLAKVTKEVVFTNGGTDVTANLAQFGVVLGSDLTGAETKPMLSLGGGAVLPIGKFLVLDLQYRFGRVFASDAGITVHRAGVGVGVRF